MVKKFEEDLRMYDDKVTALEEALQRTENENASLRKDREDLLLEKNSLNSEIEYVRQEYEEIEAKAQQKVQAEIEATLQLDHDTQVKTMGQRIAQLEGEVETARKEQEDILQANLQTMEEKDNQIRKI
jgi:uncharacterized protein YjcR